jgi:bifunctional non-homologous end joining protein LigD
VIVTNLAQLEPKLYTTHIMKAKRNGRIFLDYLRNGYGATAVAPCSERARDGAPVALPIAWKELNKNLKPNGFLLPEISGMMKSRRTDPWKGYFHLQQKVSLLED